MRKHLKLIIGLILCFASFAAATILSIPTLFSSTVSFSSHYGEKEVDLKGTYCEVKDANYAALICPGYSCDRQKWKPMSDLLVANGITTMTFDYSGQGASYGTIGFDNAKTDRIPEQIADAIRFLHEKSGIAYDHIILVGHSMGGRSILRLLHDYHCADADSQIEFQDIQNVILLSPEVNYQYNAQASLFAGTSDASEEPWKSFDADCIGNTNVYLFGSVHDDIVSDEDVLAIFQRISNADAPESGEAFVEAVNHNGAKITVHIESGVLHSYMMYSPKYGTMVNDALTEITGVRSSFPAGKLGLCYVAWFLGLPGIGLVLADLTKNHVPRRTDHVPELIDAKRFLLTKLLFWIPGIVAACLICCICVVMPMGSPVMNIPYMCFIAGYGFVMLWGYRKGRFAGTTGKLPKLQLKNHGTSKDTIICIAVSLGLCFFVWYILWSTMYRLIPWNFRLFWVIFAAAIMTIGYYVSGCENDMLKDAKASLTVRLLYNLIQYVPLILLVIFYLVLKSYSGMIGQIQNMILLYTFCIPLGNYIREKTHNRFFGALASGFVFQTLMITSAALIAIF